MIIEVNVEIDRVDDNFHVFETNDRHHENNNRSLVDVWKRNFSWITNENDEWYFLHWNNRLSKKKEAFIDLFDRISHSIGQDFRFS